MAKKMDARAFAQQKRKRRQWLTFVRMCRYGINNFSRNAWLTVAATAVMTITLLIIFITLAARQTLVDTVEQIKTRVDMSIYVRTDTPDDQASKIGDTLKKLPGVQNVSYTSPAQAKQDFARENVNNRDTLDALNEATNKLPGRFRIQIENINDPSQLDTFTKTNALYKKYEDPTHKPSFSGDRRKAIVEIGRAAQFADRVGIVASVVFVAISALIVFNTIRMAIFNRKEEIQMMKLIGADRSFIRGPFVVEAMVYGFIAALVATGLGVLALYASRDKLASYEIAVQPTIDIVTVYIGLVLLIMIALGSLIGIVSSLFATRRYLKL